MRSLLLKYSFLLLLLFSLSSNVSNDPNTKIKVIFIYNFTKYIEWPVDYKTGDFVIGVLGETSVIDELIILAQTKTVGVQKCVVKKFKSAKEITKCHMLYVPQDMSESFTDVLSKTKGMPTLLITEKEGFAKKGAIINFVSVDNKQKFELNRANASKCGLKVSSNLSTLAIMVD